MAQNRENCQASVNTAITLGSNKKENFFDNVSDCQSVKRESASRRLFRNTQQRR